MNKEAPAEAKEVRVTVLPRKKAMRCHGRASVTPNVKSERMDGGTASKPQVRWCGRGDGRNPVTSTRFGLGLSPLIVMVYRTIPVYPPGAVLIVVSTCCRGLAPVNVKIDNLELLGIPMNRCVTPGFMVACILSTFTRMSCGEGFVNTASPAGPRYDDVTAILGAAASVGVGRQLMARPKKASARIDMGFGCIDI